MPIMLVKKANFIGKLNGGEGFVREVADKIFFSHGLNPIKNSKPGMNLVIKHSKSYFF